MMSRSVPTAILLLYTQHVMNLVSKLSMFEVRVELHFPRLPFASLSCPQLVLGLFYVFLYISSIVYFLKCPRVTLVLS